MDMTDARVLVILSATDANGGFSRALMPTTSGAAFHVKIEILPNLNSTPSGLAYYVDPVPFAHGFSYTNSAAAGWPSVADFSKVNNTSFTAIPVYSVAPTINNNGLSPISIVAGVDQTLTISGSNFGTVKGKVKFKDATEGGKYYFEITGSLITSWTNNQIVVKIPSYYNDPNFDKHCTVGTGNVKIVPSNGIEATSSQILTVSYALTEALSPTNVRTYLAKMNCINGLEFTLHTSIMNMSNSTSAIACMEKALSDWSTKLGITLKLEKNGSTYVTTSNEAEPNRNIIFLDYGASADMIMGVEYNYGADYNGRTVYRKLSSDIHINPNINWDYSTSGTVSAGAVSFYQAFLHELGHAVGLDHVIDKTALMYYTIVVTKPYTIKDLNNSTSTPVTAAQKVVTDSKSITWQRPELGTLGSSIISPVSISASGSTLICNSSVTLTSSATSGNKWSSGSTSRSISVNSTGSFYTTISQPGCTRTSNTINVTACPTVTYYAINNGESSTRNILRNVKLNNTATNVPTQYIASENSSFSGASWGSYGNAPEFKLSRGRGTKTVYFKVRNAAGESPRMVDQIYYNPYISFGSTGSETLKSAEITNEHSENSTITEIEYEFSEESMSADYDITAYPVPCVDNINIVVPAQIQDVYKVAVIDINGITVLMDNINSERKSIDLSGLQKGTYIIRLIGNENTYVKTIIKQ
jgi:hypothetical protein